jgi:hypothetical protein
VQYVTATLAYLDRGASDGVTVGLTVSFTRAGRPAGSCMVDTVAEHFATCLAGQLRKGDRFAIGRKADDAFPGPPTELPDQQELAARRDVLGAYAHPLVEFDGDSGGAASHRVAVAFGHTTYSNFARLGGPFQVERLDAAVFDVDLYKGLRVSADLSVMAYSRRPDGFRSNYPPPSSPVALLVRQLEVGFRRADVPFQAALGRLWARSTPGLLVLDGAQASYRVGDWLEVGAYGGLLPDPYALTITPTQWSVGAFASLRLTSGKGADSTVGQLELRAGYATKDRLGSRVEVGLAGHLYQGKNLDAHLSAELAYGGLSQAFGGIDAVRVDVGWRPVEKLHLLLGARYRGGSPNGVVDLGLVSPGQRALHGDLAATYELTPFMTVAVTGGIAEELNSNLNALSPQVRVGPEVSFPGLFGKGSGVSFGYDEQFGWLRARSGYGQVVFLVAGRVRVLSRTTWFQQTPIDPTTVVVNGVPTPGPLVVGAFVNDLGESVNLDISLFRWLWVRASMSGRTALDPESGGARTSGLASLQVGGQF